MKIIIKFFCIITLVVCVSFSQTSKVAWSSFNAGSGIPQSSTSAIKNAVGQNFVGTSQSTNSKVGSGFLTSDIVDAVQEQGDVLPKTYSLSQNYPNPFNPKTNIRFDLPKEGFVTLKVFDILGREVTTLVNQTMNAGSYSVDFDASNLQSGIYFYRLQAGEFTAVKKLVLMK